MARARQFQEAPCQQKQSQKRTHRQPQLRAGRHLRRQSHLSCALWIAAFLRVWVGENNNTAQKRREAGAFPGDGCAIARPATAARSRRGPQNPGRRERRSTRTRAPPRRPLQSPFGPYRRLAAAAATSRSRRRQRREITPTHVRVPPVVGCAARRRTPPAVLFGSKMPRFAIQCDHARASVPAVSRPA